MFADLPKCPENFWGKGQPLLLLSFNFSTPVENKGFFWFVCLINDGKDLKTGTMALPAKL